MEKTFQVGQLKVRCFSTREEMGAAGARQAAALIRSVCRERGEANLIFASSPSQMDVLRALQQEDVDWSCVNAFHMDEYIGVGIDHPASFARYLRENFFSALPLKGVYYLNGLAPRHTRRVRPVQPPSGTAPHRHHLCRHWGKTATWPSTTPTSRTFSSPAW
jgi:hypothetical protein